MDDLTLAYALAAFSAGYALGIFIAEPKRLSYRRSFSAWVRMKWDRWGI